MTWGKAVVLGFSRNAFSRLALRVYIVAFACDVRYATTYTLKESRQDSSKVVKRRVLHIIPLIEPSAMAWDSVASTKLADVLRPKSTGEPVNAHVVKSVREPQPDFAAMKRIIEGGGQKAAEIELVDTERDVSESD
jgi:hypothetical protein